jgi:hypothetical protein
MFLKKLRNTTHSLSEQRGGEPIFEPVSNARSNTLKIPCHYSILLGKIPSLDANCHLNGKKKSLNLKYS